MSDLFGFTAPREPFADIRNQRESVADEKARLCMELNALCKTPPRTLNSASIQQVRAWRETHKSARKTLAAKDSSRAQLRSAIDSLRSYLREVA